jgi:hypothetical protein
LWVTNTKKLLMSNALGDALRRDVIATNPATLATPRGRRNEREAWTVAEARTFTRVADRDRLAASGA